MRCCLTRQCNDVEYLRTGLRKMRLPLPLMTRLSSRPAGRLTSRGAAYKASTSSVPAAKVRKTILESEYLGARPEDVSLDIHYFFRGIGASNTRFRVKI